MSSKQSDSVEQRSVSEHLGEPVAWLFYLDGCNQVVLDEDSDPLIRHNGTPLYTTPPAAPVQDIGVEQDKRVFARIEALKKPAAQRQWVGLTDEEKATAIFGADKKCLDYEGYADAIEAKLKEKNT